jgi:mRNA deadenylase 3'-5' endonuclease subunit Ccr4
MKKLLWIYFVFLLMAILIPFKGHSAGFTNPATKTISVLTFNAWLLNNGIFNARKSIYNEERTRFLIYSLVEMHPDVIALQEVRDEKSKRLIMITLAQAGYTSIIDSLESGLIIATHFELKSFSIKDINFKKSLQNKKGLLEVVINHPTLGEIHILNSSLENAHFNEELLTYDPIASAVRLKQAIELKDYVIQEHVPEGAATYVIALDVNAHTMYWDGQRFSTHFSSYEETLFNTSSNLNGPTSLYECPDDEYFSAFQNKCVQRSTVGVASSETTYAKIICDSDKYYNDNTKKCETNYYGKNIYKWCPSGFKINQDPTKNYLKGMSYCSAQVPLNLTDTYTITNPGKPFFTYDTSSNELANQNLFISKPSEIKDHIFLSKTDKLTVIGSVKALDQELTREVADKINVKVRLKHLSDHYGILTTFKGK